MANGSGRELHRSYGAQRRSPRGGAWSRCPSISHSSSVLSLAASGWRCLTSAEDFKTLFPRLPCSQGEVISVSESAKHPWPAVESLRLSRQRGHSPPPKPLAAAVVDALCTHKANYVPPHHARRTEQKGLCGSAGLQKKADLKIARVKRADARAGILGASPLSWYSHQSTV